MGTRCLPLTKAVPKELLPIYDRPALQIIAEEAAESGIHTLVLVTSRGKLGVEDHFDEHPLLLAHLEGKPDLQAAVQRAEQLCQVVSVRQGQPLGLGHAVGCAEPAVGEDPFAVVLPDDLVRDTVPALKRLVDVYERTGHGVVLLMEVPPEDTGRYGIVDAEPLADGTLRIRDLIEKPAPEAAPSNLAIVGRYVFPGGFFERIRATPPGALGEIQLTDAMRSLASEGKLLGVRLSGERLDTGSPIGVLRAALHYASDDPEARAMLREFFESTDLGPR